MRKLRHFERISLQTFPKQLMALIPASRTAMESSSSMRSRIPVTCGDYSEPYSYYSELDAYRLPDPPDGSALGRPLPETALFDKWSLGFAVIECAFESPESDVDVVGFAAKFVVELAPTCVNFYSNIRSFCIIWITVFVGTHWSIWVRSPAQKIRMSLCMARISAQITRTKSFAASLLAACWVASCERWIQR